MPLESQHSGTYICIATNQYGSTNETITLDGNLILNISLIFQCIFLGLVQAVPQDITIDIEPSNIFPIGSTIRLNCQLPQSETIWWSSVNHRRRENNPLTLRIESNYVNRRFICHAKHVNGKAYRKMIHIERYSEDYLTAILVNNEVERIYRTKPRRSMPRFRSVSFISLISSSKKTSNSCKSPHSSC